MPAITLRYTEEIDTEGIKRLLDLIPSFYTYDPFGVAQDRMEYRKL